MQILTKAGFLGTQSLSGEWGRASGGCKSGLPHFPFSPCEGWGKRNSAEALLQGKDAHNNEETA